MLDGSNELSEDEEEERYSTDDGGGKDRRLALLIDRAEEFGQGVVPPHREHCSRHLDQRRLQRGNGRENNRQHDELAPGTPPYFLAQDAQNVRLIVIDLT